MLVSTSMKWVVGGAYYWRIINEVKTKLPVRDSERLHEFAMLQHRHGSLGVHIDEIQRFIFPVKDRVAVRAFISRLKKASVNTGLLIAKGDSCYGLFIQEWLPDDEDLINR